MGLSAIFHSSLATLHRSTIVRQWACVLAACLAVAGNGVQRTAAAPGDAFSFVVIADPHICSETPGDPNRKLRACVDWINRNRQRENIELTFVVGDIGFVDGGQSIRSAKAVLDGLQAPYVPLQGDNDCVTTADEVCFADTFAPVYESLAASPQITRWQKAAAPVVDPQFARQVYLQNFSFNYRGVNFVCADWRDRDMNNYGYVRGEDADLHDFPGGTWPWFTDTIATCPKDKQENIVMLSHHPMHTMGGDLAFLAAYAGFAPPEFARIDAFLRDPNYDYASHVAQAYGGHYHFEAFLPADMDPNRINVAGFPVDPNRLDPGVLVPLPGYDLHIVGAAFAEPSVLSLVRVTEGTDCFYYETTSVIVPEPSVLGLALLGQVLRRKQGTRQKGWTRYADLLRSRRRDRDAIPGRNRPNARAERRDF